MPISPFTILQPIFDSCHPVHSQDLYSRATLFIQHKSLIIHSLIRNANRASFLTALALPGIMRAIRFSNLLKIRFMEWKYTRFGHLPVDYTVGDLQMRLSLAEEIEQYLKEHPPLQSKAGLLLYPPVPEKNMRYMRLKRMHNLDWQLRYLRAFDVVMRHRFNQVCFDDELQKLRFYTHIYYHGSLLHAEAPLPAGERNTSGLKGWEADCAVQFYLHGAEQTLW